MTHFSTNKTAYATAARRVGIAVFAERSTMADGHDFALIARCTH